MSQLRAGGFPVPFRAASRAPYQRHTFPDMQPQAMPA